MERGVKRIVEADHVERREMGMGREGKQEGKRERGKSK